MLFNNCLYIKVCAGARIRGEKIYAGTVFCTNIKNVANAGCNNIVTSV